jgi:hypothetical protein
MVKCDATFVQMPECGRKAVRIKQLLQGLTSCNLACSLRDARFEMKDETKPAAQKGCLEPHTAVPEPRKPDALVDTGCPSQSSQMVFFTFLKLIFPFELLDLSFDNRGNIFELVFFNNY